MEFGALELLTRFMGNYRASSSKITQEVSCPHHFDHLLVMKLRITF